MFRKIAARLSSSNPRYSQEICCIGSLETQKEITAGWWWYTYPSEKYESMGRIIPFLLWNKKNVWNHQPVLYWITRNSKKSHHFQVPFTHGTQRFVAQSSPQLPRRFRVRSSTRGTCTRGSCAASCETFAWDAVEMCGFLDLLIFWIEKNIIPKNQQIQKKQQIQEFSSNLIFKTCILFLFSLVGVVMFYPPATWRRGTSTILMGKSSRRRLSIAMITRGYSLVNIQKAIENGHGNEIYPSKMVIFHSYVAVYQRVVTSYNNSMWFKRQSWCDLASGHLFSSSDWNGPLIPEMVILSFLSVSSLCVRLPLTYTPFTSVNDTISRAKLWLKHLSIWRSPPPVLQGCVIGCRWCLSLLRVA